MATPHHPTSKDTPTRRNTLTAASGSAPGAKLPGRSGPSVSLSARTCLEFLPQLDETQLDYEIKYLQTLDPTWTCKATKFKGKQDVLRKHLNKTLHFEMGKTIEKLSKISPQS